VVAKVMLYDAVTMASQDGYSNEEKERSAKAASILGIDDEDREELELLVAEERKLLTRKHQLFDVGFNLEEWIATGGEQPDDVP